MTARKTFKNSSLKSTLDFYYTESYRVLYHTRKYDVIHETIEEMHIDILTNIFYYLLEEEFYNAIY